MKEYDFYIFDLDNTLVDSSKGYEKAYRTAFREFDMPYDPSKYHEYIRTPLEVVFDMHCKNPTPCKFREFYAIALKTYDKCHTESVDLFPDARECIMALALAGKSMGVVSNSGTPHIKNILSNLGVSGLFGSFVGLERVVVPKPDPEPVLLCIREIDAIGEATVMIGDSVADIAAGSGAGIDTALVTRYGEHPQDCEPTYYVKSLKEVIPFRLL
ncbi:MAG: HAD family hydrolase [Candidatus Methanoplasma sp.]|jgi:HAD superfamily hydrolase (TIGR01549 family)|nr:HAD family hydrolase [Candidatus Methanoplasma sp.]